MPRQSLLRTHTHRHTYVHANISMCYSYALYLEPLTCCRSEHSCTLWLIAIKHSWVNQNKKKKKNDKRPFVLSPPLCDTFSIVFALLSPLLTRWSSSEPNGNPRDALKAMSFVCWLSHPASQQIRQCGRNTHGCLLRQLLLCSHLRLH